METVLLGMRSSGEPTIGWAIPRRPTAPWPLAGPWSAWPGIIEFPS